MIPPSFGLFVPSLIFFRVSSSPSLLIFRGPDVLGVEYFNFSVKFFRRYRHCQTVISPARSLIVVGTSRDYGIVVRVPGPLVLFVSDITKL